MFYEILKKKKDYKGYSIVLTYNGWYIAENHPKHFQADTLRGLKNLITNDIRICKINYLSLS